MKKYILGLFLLISLLVLSTSNEKINSKAIVNEVLENNNNSASKEVDIYSNKENIDKNTAASKTKPENDSLSNETKIVVENDETSSKNSDKTKLEVEDEVNKEGKILENNKKDIGNKIVNVDEKNYSTENDGKTNEKLEGTDDSSNNLTRENFEIIKDNEINESSNGEDKKEPFSQDEIVSNFNEGKRYLENKSYNEAIHYFNQLTEYKPQEELLPLLLMAYEGLEDKEKIDELVNKIEDLNFNKGNYDKSNEAPLSQEEVVFIFNEGKRYLENKSYNEAIHYFNQLTEYKPQEELLPLLLMAYEGLEDNKKIDELVNKIEDVNFNKGNYDKSNEAPLSQEEVVFIFNEGKRYLENKSYNEAIHYFNQLTEYKSQEELLPLLLKAYEGLEDNKKIDELVNKIEDLNIDAEKEKIDIGNTLNKIESTYNSHVARNDPYGQFVAGTAARFHGRYSEAIEHFTKTIKKEPGMYEAYLGRGIAYRSKNNFKEAIDDMLMYIKFKKDPLVYAGIADMYLVLENKRSAKNILNKALEFYPQDEFLNELYQESIN